MSVRYLVDKVEKIVDKSSETAKEISRISKPGSEEREAHSKLLADFSKAIAKGTSMGIVEVAVDSKSFVGSFLNDKKNHTWCSYIYYLLNIYWIVVCKYFQLFEQ